MRAIHVNAVVVPVVAIVVIGAAMGLRVDLILLGIAGFAVLMLGLWLGNYRGGVR